MSVKIFRNHNWIRIKSGGISRTDITKLDWDLDRELIAYLMAHAPEASRRDLLRYASSTYGMEAMPEPRINIDDPEDVFYGEYFVLREQVMREDDPTVLKEAALDPSDRDAAAFAFSRLTGYSRAPDHADAFLDLVSANRETKEGVSKMKHPLNHDNDIWWGDDSHIS